MDNSRCKIFDSAFISRIQSGDKEAFSELYHTYFPRLCDFVYRYVKTKAVCEGLVQDLFLNIWGRHDKWDPKGTPKSYLYKAARNRALDYLKHLQVEREYLQVQKIEIARERESLISTQFHSLSQQENPSACDPDIIEAVNQAINQLPGQRRVIFLMSREDGLTYREIAEVLDISIKTVETQMGRSLKFLRCQLSGYLSDENKVS